MLHASEMQITVSVATAATNCRKIQGHCVILKRVKDRCKLEPSRVSVKQAKAYGVKDCFAETYQIYAVQYVQMHLGQQGGIFGQFYSMTCSYL